MSVDLSPAHSQYGANSGRVFGFGRARVADRLNIAQPALSQALTRREKALGVKLFNRTRRGADLHAAGLASVEDVRMSESRRVRLQRDSSDTVATPSMVIRSDAAT
ncbi:regulatory helix-turn-helix LysR family protein [Paraburkholderia sp. BL27I4N3]|uniref:helix-turn-helix domain-containing protein n=1 Tax=Paraburkholderia sp. BL27I4N3 TaxID=1938805 RepID=UPI000E25BE6B|nr:regulatory helix-turn-helix LysR family protein [Paraburkholderia sp. BL27I4N3]RKR46098.1 regulatory helix-turn-helix LysR family protein [Paraburkholderia sp. BL17N1]